MYTFYEYTTWLVSYPVNGVMYLPKYFYYGFYAINPGEYSKGITWGVKLGLTASLILGTATGVVPAGIYTANVIISYYLINNDIE